ncbi:MAG: hypothetical protein JW953_03610 [Anaerolineae bacterium]|nr:hypothetical protein [Anaerolineae bacterium]
MKRYAILLAVRPQSANQIFEGSKTVDLRRVRPRYINPGTLVLLYVAAPVKTIAGAFKVGKVVEAPLEALWSQVNGQAGVTREEFEAYYGGLTRGVGIFFLEVRRFTDPLPFQELKEKMAGFYPPQGFRYVKPDELMLVSARLGDFGGRIKVSVQRSLLEEEKIVGVYF